MDIDPDAVSESLELLEGNQCATAIRANVREPRAILDHPQVRNLLDFDQPIAVLLVQVLHFVEDPDEVSDMLTTFRSALAPGSYLMVAHATIDELIVDKRLWGKTQKEYRQQTTTPLVPRKGRRGPAPRRVRDGRSWSRLAQHLAAGSGHGR